MKKILLIEDNRGITEGLCDTFTEPEYELLIAGSLKEAGALLSEHPGLVLLDVSLPDGNGFLQRTAGKRKNTGDFSYRKG